MLIRAVLSGAAPSFPTLTNGEIIFSIEQCHVPQSISVVNNGIGCFFKGSHRRHPVYPHPSFNVRKPGVASDNMTQSHQHLSVCIQCNCSCIPCVFTIGGATFVRFLPILHFLHLLFVCLFFNFFMIMFVIFDGN